MMNNMFSWLTSLDPFTLIAAFPLIFLLFSFLVPKKRDFPLLYGRHWFEFSDAGAKQRFVRDAHSMIKAGLKVAPIFRIISDNGPKTVLAPKYAPEIRCHPDLSFGAGIAKEFHSSIHSFEPFRQGTSSDELFQTAIRTKLTQSLGTVTEPLSNEATHALEQEWTDNPDWHSLELKPSILKVVAQLSSKVFLGDQICRNPDWLRITISYTIDSFVAALALRRWPEFLRPLIANFLPCCRKVRRELEEAKSIINPVLDERRRLKTEAAQTGKSVPRFNDAMQWMEEVAKGRAYSPDVAQMSFSLAAIHTTSDMLTQVLLDICDEEEIIQALREEIISVIRVEGWKKTTLYKLKIMDSVLKESQRLKPIGIASMRRLVAKDIQLSDGSLIRKGTLLMVSGERMWDSQVYTNPETFDPYRFLRLREIPGHETSAQLVSPSPEHLGFGYGNHACPGRFFAANEVKIALCHILLKYDLRLAPGSASPRVRKTGVSWNADPTAKLSIRRRREEICF